MRSINNREELNGYYYTVQAVIEKYLSLHKVKPSELFNYVRNNLTDIVEECEMSDVVGANKIVLDVATHLNSVELDGVMTFESFRRRFM
jgi:hypothetical protein